MLAPLGRQLVSISIIDAEQIHFGGSVLFCSIVGGTFKTVVENESLLVYCFTYCSNGGTLE